MERTLNREYRLNTDEVKQALTEFLEARDLPIGDTQTFDFGFSIDGCTITSHEEAQIELQEQHGVR